MPNWTIFWGHYFYNRITWLPTVPAGRSTWPARTWKHKYQHDFLIASLANKQKTLLNLLWRTTMRRTRRSVNNSLISCHLIFSFTVLFNLLAIFSQKNVTNRASLSWPWLCYRIASLSRVGTFMAMLISPPFLRSRLPQSLHQRPRGCSLLSLCILRALKHMQGLSLCVCCVCAPLMMILVMVCISIPLMYFLYGKAVNFLYSIEVRPDAREIWKIKPKHK